MEININKADPKIKIKLKISKKKTIQIKTNSKKKIIMKLNSMRKIFRYKKIFDLIWDIIFCNDALLILQKSKNINYI